MKTFKTLFLAIAILATYSIHAQVSVTTDGSSADGSAMLEVKSTTKGFLPPRMTEDQRGEISSPATGLIIYQTDGTAGLYQYNGTAWAAIGGSSSGSRYLGEEYLGGIIFHLYTGSDGQQHGLIVSKTEGSFLEWSSSTTTLIGATRTWDGVYNMNLMTSSTAKDWVTTNFSEEWYLPSIDELMLLWNNRFHVNKGLFEANGTLFPLPLNPFYWSSTEYSNQYAMYLNFYKGETLYYSKTNDIYVRAVRAF